MTEKKVKLFGNKKENNLKEKDLIKHGPIHKAQSINPELVFLKGCLSSFKDDKLFFSNFILDTLSNYNDFLGHDFENVFCCEKVELNTNGINLDRKNGKRIKSIIKLCNGNIDFDGVLSDLIYEVYVTNGAELDSKRKGKFRVFSVYFQKTKNKDHPQCFVFLLDPYHLVCPTNIKNKNESIEKKYFKVKKYDCSLNALFEEKCKKNDIDKSKIRFLENSEFLKMVQGIIKEGGFRLKK